MKIAVYESIANDSRLVLEVSNYTETMRDYLRTTEILDADFKPRPPAEVVGNQLDALTELEAKVEEEYTTKIRAIKTRRAELAALTYTAPMTAAEVRERMQ